MNLKKGLKKFWYIVWKDNSLKGWIISLVFLFIVVKFIFFPLLSLTTGSSLPLAIVESCSMYHKGDLISDFDSWWERHSKKYLEIGITKEEFKDFTMNNGFNKGDILLITRANEGNLNVGDIIVFEANQRNPVIHRIIEIKRENGITTYSTIGDNNNGQFQFEKGITENKIIGKAKSKISPYIGWIKLIFYEGNKPKSERGLCSENSG